MGFLLSLFFGVVPMLLFAGFVYWLDRYEKEPKVLLGGVFVWGAVVAAGTAFIVNTVLGVGVYIFTGSEAATELSTGSMIAPVVEETLKGLAVLLVFLVARREFDSILDGIIYAAITALGFAATENTYYIYAKGYAEEGYVGLAALAFVRVILVGWQHPFYTAFTGIGLAIARLNRGCAVKLLAPVLGWVVAVITHSFHNTVASLLSGIGGLLLGSAIDWTGWFFMFLFALWAIWREKQLMVRFLREEVALGTITPQQYQTASSTWKRWKAALSALGSRRYGPTGRFYQVCAELVHKRNQLASMGEEDGNSQIIMDLRAELARLSPLAA